MDATARTQYRALVADVAARATAILPTQVNGRIEKAVKLVLAGDVEPQDDGTVTVYSATDPTRRYVLQGLTCTCTDFERGQAPQGWCQHRIAAGIAKRVNELLPQSPPVETEPAPPPAPVPVPLPEARCSVNVRVPIAGRDTQITLRGHDELEVLTRLEALLQRYPLTPPAPQAQLTTQQHNALAQHRPITQTGWCAIHDLEMRWNEGKDGRKGWFSHKTPDGTWCKGR